MGRPLHEKSQRKEASEQIKSDVYTAQCAAVVESLDKPGMATAAAVDMETTPPCSMGTRLRTRVCGETCLLFGCNFMKRLSTRSARW